MTNSRLILALCASLTALAFGTANAQTIYHSDGTTTTIIGNTLITRTAAPQLRSATLPITLMVRRLPE